MKMPKRKPMLCTLIKEPFDSEDWIFETKWDGFRAFAYKDKTIRLSSRNGLSFKERFPLIVKELSSLKETFLFDGEIVVVDKTGNSCFQLLQNSSMPEKTHYYIFDLLFYRGKDLTSLPLFS